ncbi:MAG: RNA-directed DNA polymerase [Actinomycetota bacterium]
MATLSSTDGEAWERLGGVVAAVVEPGLDPRVLGSRAVSGCSGWRLRALGPGLRRARRMATALAGSTALVLRTDVAAFYPSVTPRVLARAVRSAGVEPREARRVADLLEGWGSEGYPGLPIGPHASAVMANAVLRQADRAVARFPFLRWMDDYLVAVPSQRAAVEVLDLLDAALAALGLSRSEPKTRVLEGRSRFRWLGASVI